MSIKEALLPDWVPLNPAEEKASLSESTRCYMTEVQLQAILDHQGDPEKGFDPDMMSTADGRTISRYSLEAVTLGEDVNEQFRKAFMSFSKQFVGRRQGVSHEVWSAQGAHGLQREPLQV